MSIIKCKMCGGDLNIIEGASTAECEFCGSVQTLPKANDEVIQNLFNRANNLRIKCEFDKAEQIYEKILQENDAESEAHWGIVLCKYGIEYVEDPKTYKRIPTSHRTSYDAVTTDADYLAAIEHADCVQKAIYEAEAKAIDAIQKDILNIVRNEKPFDVFICYKETDENGKRTQDSVIANDIYYQLTQEGLKVFYAAITLEDKLGQEYEPYIFAALNSSKVMLVIGTKPQYFTAVWVKNEWSRFLKLMKADRSKLLIPCYKDMDAYDLPEEFSHLQAQDMSKIGFINDVVRGIKKVTVKDEPKTTAVKETVVAGNASTAPLLKRAFMFLEDGDWDSANGYCEKVLDLDPECAEAYVGKLMAELQVKKQDDLKDRAEIFDDSSNYQKAIRFANEELKSALTGYIEHINVRNANARLEEKYAQAIAAMNGAQTEDSYLIAAGFFNAIGTYKDSAALAQECREKAECARKNEIYSRAKGLMQSDDHTKIRQAIPLFESVSGWKDADDLKAQCPDLAETARKDSIYFLHKRLFTCAGKPIEEEWAAAQKGFESISGWKDADALAQQCVEQIEKLKEEQAERERKAEADRIEQEHQAELARQKAEKLARKKKAIAIIAASIACVIIAFLIVFTTVIMPPQNYKKAEEAFLAENYAEAAITFGKLGDYQDAKEKSRAAWEKIVEWKKTASNEYIQAEIQDDGTVKLTLKKEPKAGASEETMWNNTSAAVGNWTDIVSVIVDYYAVYALKGDGTVVYTYPNYREKLTPVNRWTDVVDIALCLDGLMGIKTDGSVVAAGFFSYRDILLEEAIPQKVSGWKNVVKIEFVDKYAYKDDEIHGITKDGKTYVIKRSDFPKS